MVNQRERLGPRRPVTQIIIHFQPAADALPGLLRPGEFTVEGGDAARRPKGKQNNVARIGHKLANEKQTSPIVAS
jgi:hypothetical protein